MWPRMVYEATVVFSSSLNDSKCRYMENTRCSGKSQIIQILLPFPIPLVMYLCSNYPRLPYKIFKFAKINKPYELRFNVTKDTVLLASVLIG